MASPEEEPKSAGPASATGPAAAEAARSPPSSPPAEEKPEEDWATRYRYLLAEFDNFRKRAEREREGVRREVRGLVLRELLPLKESIDRAREASEHLAKDHPFRRGLELVHAEWERFLKSQHVEPVAKVGEPFRAEEHEAIGERPADADHPAGTVTEIVQQGYRSSAVLIRPAKVIVARSAPPPQSAERSGSVTSPP